MKILWITNAPFPEISGKFQLKEVVKGWVNSSAVELVENYKNIRLAVVSMYSGNEFKIVNSENNSYYLIPQKSLFNKTTRNIDFYWKEIHSHFNADVVHIHGTEYPHAYSYVKKYGSKNIVVSIQGLVSVIERYYFGGIIKTELLKTVTLWDFIRGNTIFAQHRDFQKRSIAETKLLQDVSHTIGRTTWDRCHALTINPNINYHFCNETLRPSFYKKNWDINQCNRYSIFISQAYYPIKGFHQLIKALPIVLKSFPKTKVFVAGNNLFTDRGLKRNGYGCYITKIIKRNQLTDKIHFLGILNEKKLSEHLCQSHIFVSPSAIENSSNSIGEAQIMGVPCVASYAGGTPDLIEHNKTGLLYRFEETEMLAANICKIFSDNEFARKLSNKSKVAANIRHDKKTNAESLYKIYNSIIHSNS
jgi:glycosyltransferase involved in cell wall biosynthesis